MFVYCHGITRLISDVNICKDTTMSFVLCRNKMKAKREKKYIYERICGVKDFFVFKHFEFGIRFGIVK